MKHLAHWTKAGLALSAALASALALAQESPESLLPRDFDRPAARPSRAPAPRASAASASTSVSIPVVQAVPGAGKAADAPAALTHAPSSVFGNGTPTLAQIQSLPPDQLDELLGLKPRYDIPPGARRSLLRVGVIDLDKGGLPPFALAHQDPSLVRAALAGNGGQMVSRWGHILLRRALLSRLDAPAGMDPGEFVALRAGLLLRMGEGDAARALVQDVDPDAYGPALIDTAFDAYVATADLTGFCPVQAKWPAARKDGGWQVMKAICASFTGNAGAGMAQLDHLTYIGAMPRVDMLLAQKYAGAAGIAGKGGQRAVKIEWDGVDDLTPWRYALTIATGLTPPDALMKDMGGRFDTMTVLAPMVGLGPRADASDRSGGIGVLSSAAMVDLYSQIYSDDGIKGGAADRALLLRDAYVGDSPATRVDAIRKLWDGTGDDTARYARLVLTAYAAARLPVGSATGDDAGNLIAAMLAAGLDANAMRWRNSVDAGSLGWALLALASPGSGPTIDGGALDTFRTSDKSDKSRRTALLIAGLAGLGRVGESDRRAAADRVGARFDGGTRWTRAIDQAAAVDNPALVALLAGLGMQGTGWDKMTPRYLYHIVAALNRVGMAGEARMIAAEAVARG